MDTEFDTLSPIALQILRARPDAYQTLVVRGGVPAEAQNFLHGVQPEQLFKVPAKSDAQAIAVLAGLWLWHDGLEQSHVLSQSLSSTTGSFWHAIMHRREGDFSNSKYWYGRAAGHPVLTILEHQAGSILHQAPADKSLLRVIASGWNPNALVDLVESVDLQPDDPRFPLAVRLQQLEWKLLFDHCART